MFYRIVYQKSMLVISVLAVVVMLYMSGSVMVSDVYASTKPKPKPKATLTLNIPCGPLGVRLTVKGKNFHAGQASLSYVDALNVPGIFAAPSDNRVQVAQDGTFTSTNVILPVTGPVGTWKIVITDSVGMVVSAGYAVLAAPGIAAAGPPTLVINPLSGKPGDLVAFTGNNWLPQGTSVTLRLQVGTTTIALFGSPLLADTNGAIMGSFSVPQGLDPTQSAATVSAVDASNALQAQTPLTLLNLVPTPSVSPTPAITPTPRSVAYSVPSTGGPGGGLFALLGGDTTIIVLLIVGGSLGIAALMLILFLVPWGERERERERRQKPLRSRQW